MKHFDENGNFIEFDPEPDLASDFDSNEEVEIKYNYKESKD